MSDSPLSFSSYVEEAPQSRNNHSHHRKKKETYSASKLEIDFAMLYGWFLGFWNSIFSIAGTVKAMTMVAPFVTGFWEVSETREYCYGPVDNPRPFHSEVIPKSFKGKLARVYVVVTEEVIVIKHSIWPSLEWDLASFGNEEEPSVDDDVSDLYDLPSTPLRPPTRIGGPHGIYHATYILLAISRAFCYVFVRAALPRAIPDEMKTIKYEIFPVPKKDQSADMSAKLDSRVFKPARTDLIRGTEAFKAARRAGFFLPAN